MKNGFIIQSKILNKALESKLQDSNLNGFIESKTQRAGLSNSFG